MRLYGGLHVLERRQVEGAELAIALKSAPHNCLAGRAANAFALIGVLVLVLAAHERLVDFNGAFEGLIERLGAGRMAKTVQHEPSGFLCHLDIAGERGASNALLVRSDEPDRHEPLAERNFAIFEDRADFDAEALLAVAALVVPVIGEVIDLRGAAMRTVRVFVIGTPADRAQMVNRGLFVRKGFHHLKQAVEGFHGYRSDPIA